MSRKATTDRARGGRRDLGWEAAGLDASSARARNAREPGDAVVIALCSLSTHGCRRLALTGQRRKSMHNYPLKLTVTPLACASVAPAA